MVSCLSLDCGVYLFICFLFIVPQIGKHHNPNLWMRVYEGKMGVKRFQLQSNINIFCLFYFLLNKISINNSTTIRMINTVYFKHTDIGQFIVAYKNLTGLPIFGRNKREAIRYFDWS